MAISILDSVQNALNYHLAREERTGKECCGVLLGRDDRVASLRLMRNASPNPKHEFQFDSSAQLEVWHRYYRTGYIHNLLGIYHSHPNAEAYPSAVDIVHGSLYPDLHHMIISPRQIRSFRIDNGFVTEEEVAIYSISDARVN